MSKQISPYSVVYYKLPDNQYKTSYTYEYSLEKRNKLVNWFLRFQFFIRALFVFDIFHFISGETLLTRKLIKYELWIYKALGKKIIMHFVGADIRSSEYLEWKNTNINRYLNGEKPPVPINKKFQEKIIQSSVKYADYILVSTPDLLKIIPKAIYFPVLLDIDSIYQEIRGITKTTSEKIRILHSPSGTKTKGSTYIYDVLEKLKNKYPDKVDLVLPLGKELSYALPRVELLKQMMQVDIVIDQMLIGWYGLKTVEALAFENEVICYIDDDLKVFLFDKCPITLANVNTLESVLEDFITNKKTQSLKKLEWVKKYHSIENNNEILKRYGWNEKFI